ncbi:solute carrier family 15 member 4-like [Ptychodera flava]|uniref:solute carrier family 15 member 4-like n=1 Tax=Ptychodera flava TaxID=63121 RepID=UPI00396A303F
MDRTERKPLLSRQRSTESDVFVHRSKPRRVFACTSVLVTECLERVAFYGVTANIVLFLNHRPFDWLAQNAASALFFLMGLLYVMSVLCGWLADTTLGRFKTIALSFIIYMVGIAFLPFLGYGSEPENDEFLTKMCGEHDWYDLQDEVPTPSNKWTWTMFEEYCAWAVFLSLFIISVGAGSIRANLAPFGADQVKHEGPELTRAFFNWYYWSINLGSLIALGLVAYIQQNINFYIGFLIPAVAVILAFLVFVVGRCCYLVKKPAGSVLTNTFRIICTAFRNRKRRRDYLHDRGEHPFDVTPPPGFLDMAKIRYGGCFHESSVEDVKSLSKVIPVFLALIPYWMVYFQMMTTFLIQGLHMKISPNAQNSTALNGTGYQTAVPYEKGFQVPASWLMLFDVLLLLVLIPIMDRLVYPCLDRRGCHLSMLKRIAIGMVFSTMAMASAGILEQQRRSCYEDVTCGEWPQTISDTTYYGANMWIFWQIPQYTLIGISEVFASVAGLEFAYSQAPKSMQGLIMGLFCLSSGIGSLFGSGLLFIVSLPHINWMQKTDAGNINNSHLEYYFFLLGGIQFVTLLVFVLLTRKYERTDKNLHVKNGTMNGYMEGSPSRHVQRGSISSFE